MPAVADIMTPDPVTAVRDTSLGEVLEMMKSHACRQIPVTEAGRVIGIITDRDIRLAMNSSFVLHERAQDQALLNNVTAEACMTRDPMTVEVSLSAVEAAELLLKYKFGGLPVVKDGKLVGIVTVSDILKHYIALQKS
jgi:acetoin utilization protein AcuB